MAPLSLSPSAKIALNLLASALGGFTALAPLGPRSAFFTSGCVLLVLAMPPPLAARRGSPHDRHALQRGL
eukprot:13902871-Alexandrium_andersonii.AAC.1